MFCSIVFFLDNLDAFLIKYAHAIKGLVLNCTKHHIDFTIWFMDIMRGKKERKRKGHKIY